MEYIHNIGDIHRYLSCKQLKYQMTALTADEVNDKNQFIKVIETMETLTERMNKNHRDIIIIIDRRHESNTNDLFYMLSCDKFTLHELRENYFIGFEYELIGNTIIKLYTHYGTNYSLRFYGEHLIWFIPRLFFKQLLFENEKEYLNAIYSHQYKHGICCNLNDDEMFEKYYKIITKYDHISVNYNRKIIGMMDEDGGDIKYDEISMQNDGCMCSHSNVLSINKCSYVQYISDKLLLFKELKDILNDTYDLNKLLQCYDHLMRFHNELKDKQYFINCKYKASDCEIVYKYIGTTRENMDTLKAENRDILYETLCSLHCYLLHSDEKTLHRLCTIANFKRYRIVSDNKEGINCGVHILKWLRYDEEATFDCFKDEILKNKNSTIDIGLWQHYRNECMIKCKNINTNFELLTISELMAVKLYSDTTRFQSLLRDCFASNTCSAVHKSYYWWGLNLYKAYLYAAKPIQSTIYYSGTHKENAYHKYHGPVSVTDRRCVVSSFCAKKANGKLIINMSNNSKGIKLNWISHFKNEYEILLFDQYLPIQTETDTVDDNMHKQTHVQSIDDVEHLLSTLQSGADISQFNINKELLSQINLVKQHHLLFATIDNNKNVTVLHRLIKELNINELQLALKVFSSKFELLSMHQAFNYCSYKIHIDKNDTALHQEFKNYKYKIKKQKGSEYGLKYDDELVIKEDGIYNIYISNCEEKYYLLQTIDCIQFSNSNFYDELCKKLKLIHNDTILKLKHISKIPIHYHNDIVSAKYLLKICDDNHKNYYKFKSISQINMVIPYQPGHNRCDLYVQPKKHHQFVFLAKIKYHHKNTTAAKLNHLFCLLKYYNKTIKNPGKVLNTFNLSTNEIENELVPSLLSHKDMLYHMAKTKMSTKKQVSLLYRLVNELQLKRLSPLLPIFKSKLKRVQAHKFKIAIKKKYDFFTKCQYKLEILNDDDTDEKSENTLIYFKYNDELTIKQKGKFNIYIKNSEIFNIDQYILIQKMSLQCNYLSNLIECNYLSNLIENLFLCQTENVIKLRNPQSIPQQCQQQILNAKYMLTYNNNDENKDNIFTFDRMNKFEIPLPIATQLYSYNILIKAKDKSKFAVIKSDMNVAVVKCENNISIKRHFKIKKWNYYDKYSGVLRLFCKKNIEIGFNGIIDANGCGYDRSKVSKPNDEKSSEQNDLSVLRFGDGHSDNCGGGIIELISSNCITNKGRIESNGLLSGNGGTIKIKCKHFINEGTISAKRDGKIYIICQQFDDITNDEKSNISPEPNVIIVKDEELKNIECNDIFTPIYNLNVTPKGNIVNNINLTYYKHNGHFENRDEYHPKHLLANNKQIFICAKSKYCNWIIFAMKYEYFINEIKIKNVDNECGIKSIRLYLGNRHNDNKWYPLHKDPINIQINDKQSKKYQSFNIEPVIDFKAIYHDKLCLIKIQIFENHGGKQNAFKEFQIAGRRIH